MIEDVVKKSAVRLDSKHPFCSFRVALTTGAF